MAQRADSDKYQLQEKSKKALGLLLPIADMNTQKGDNAVEYKLRVPRNLVKDYYVMKLNAPRPINFSEISDAYLSRHAPSQGEDEATVGSVTGAGSEYGKEWKEEMKKKRRGHVKKEISKEDMLYSLKLCGKKDKRFEGKKEGTILENSAYYILTQCPDGVFEAVPIQAWYTFQPKINYQTLSLDDAERELSKRDKTINFHNLMMQKRLQASEENNEEQRVRDKVSSTFRDDLVIHDDDEDSDSGKSSEESEADEKKGKQKKSNKGKKKDTYTSKKKKKKDDEDNFGDFDSDEEEELDNRESKECDYMSESSSNDEAELLEDEPGPETNKKTKAKDDLNAFTLSDSEEEEETEEGLTSAGKELKEILKREAGDEESSLDEDDDDIDDDEKYSKSALFMQGTDGKKKKSDRSGSVSGSSSSSRSATPTQQGDSSQTTTPPLGKKAKDGKLRTEAANRLTPTPQANRRDIESPASRKRPNSRESGDGTPPSKKEKLQASASSSKKPKEAQDSSKKQKSLQMPSETSLSNSKEPLAITETTIRRYLAHKPMTTTDLVKKFKTKKTGLTKEQTVSTIAAILKRIGPERQRIDGKLYLSLKPSKK